ncbi:MAG TPA: hypothetical protein VFE25_01515 [Opitutaceae bacterium]|jgi:hypothetical protein|nr:hypothetical protein [Opitutaceae bacterium]
MSADNSWQKLAAAARKAPPVKADESAPYGFSTRVAALAFEQQPAANNAFARYSLRAAAFACALALGAVAANYTAIKGAFSDDGAAPAADDPIAEVVDLGT